MESKKGKGKKQEIGQMKFGVEEEPGF